MDNTKHMVQDIHDILKSYFIVARKRFVDTMYAGWRLLPPDWSRLAIADLWHGVRNRTVCDAARHGRRGRRFDETIAEDLNQRSSLESKDTRGYLRSEEVR